MLRGVAGERFEGALEQYARDGGGAAFVRVGHGEALLRSGDRCVGLWREGALHGDGTCHYANGDVYVGAWDAGQRCGRGRQPVLTPLMPQLPPSRRKRALVLDSEGEQEAEVNLARGRKMAAVLASEAAMQEHTNIGRGEASAIEAKAAANAAAIRLLAAAVVGEGGQTAMRLRVAEQYVAAFSRIAKAGNTVVVPANVGDAGAMVAQAMGIFKAMDRSGGGGGGGGDGAAATEEVSADVQALRSWAAQAERAQLPLGGLEESELEERAGHEDGSGHPK